jgi:hypothetical protein
MPRSLDITRRQAPVFRPEKLTNTRWSSRRLAPVLSGTEGTAITLKQRLPLTSIIIYSILSLIEGVFLRFISKKITAATIAPAIIPIIPGVPKKYPTAAPINNTIIYVSVFILLRTPARMY